LLPERGKQLQLLDSTVRIGQYSLICYLQPLLAVTDGLVNGATYDGFA